MRADIEGERRSSEVLQSHPLRTRNPEDALEVFIISAPITELLGYGNRAVFDEVFNALFDNTVFLLNIEMIPMSSFLKAGWHSTESIQSTSKGFQETTSLRNMTVATSYDPFGCFELYNQLENDPQSHSDFASLFEEVQPVTNAFSIGLGYSSLVSDPARDLSKVRRVQALFVSTIQEKAISVTVLQGSETCC